MVDEIMPETPNETEGLRIYSYVQSLKDQGASPESIQAELVKKGVAPEEAAALIRRILERDKKLQIRHLAEPLVKEGVQAEEIGHMLTAKGFDSLSVASVVKDLVEERNRTRQEERGDPRPFYRILGIVLIVVGFALMLGNLSGLFPTFSYAGTFTLGLGAAIYVVGSRLG